MPVITVNATKDATMMQEIPTAWNGKDAHLPVGNDPLDRTYRSVVYFPLSFVGWTHVNLATLRLFGSKTASSHINSTVTRQVFIRRATSDWGEGLGGEGIPGYITGQSWHWNNRNDKFTTDSQSSHTFTSGLSDAVAYDIDVTGIVLNWFAGHANYGFFINAQTEANGQVGVEFYSRESPGFVPQLIIDYSGNLAPNAPQSLFPTGDALINSLTPLIGGTASDPDAIDSVSAFQIRVYQDDGTTLIWGTGTIDGSGQTFSIVYGGPALQGNTFYKWKGRTRDQGGLWGPYSSLQRFKTNTPPNPPALAITQSPILDLKTLTPTLNITHSDNDPADTTMYGYRAIVETAAGALVWDSGDVDTSGAPVTVKSFTYAGPALAWRTAYRWRARTKDVNGAWGNYSAYQSFTTHSTAVPTSLDPTLSETISGLVPTFSGSRGDTNDTITSYQIILYESNGQTVVWDSGTLTTQIVNGASFTKAYTGTALSYGVVYQWKARVTGSIGGTSNYSALQTFQTPVDATVPTLNLPTTNNSPTNNNVTSLTPTLTGQRGSNFTDYQIQLYDSAASTANLGTPIWDSGTLTQASGASFSKVYNGAALAWGTTYKWRVRVGAPTLGAWTGLSQFTTDLAGTPTLTAPTNGEWITSLTPTLQGSTSGGELASQYQILLYEFNGTLKWDSGLLAQANSTTFSKVYNGPALTGGNDYYWQARYVKSTGPIGSYSAVSAFHVNAVPSIPTQLFPTPGYTLNNSLFPTFEAYFNDLDKSARADFPTEWHIEIRNNGTDALIQEKVISTGLATGLNTYVWGTNTGGSDTGLAYDIDYKWRTWFEDSKGGEGAKSSYQIFSAGTPPTISIVTPSNGSNINTTRPTVLWTFAGSAGKTQSKFRLKIIRDFNDVVVYDSGDTISTVSSVVIPTGYMQVNGEFYTIEVVAWDTDNLASAEAVSTVELQLAAPPRVEGLSVTVYEDLSRVRLDWDPSVLGVNFVTYVVYRRKVGESEWGVIGTVKPESRVVFNDYYAGQTTTYEYRVTVVKLIGGEPDLESPDSDIAQGRLESDVWYVIGADRSHIFELPVSSETHTRPVQQEAFEPIGSNRKAVVRGFVLGHEGSLDVVWMHEEKPDYDENMAYLIYQAGPHILKNPFGDVYEATFGSQDGAYEVGGTHQMTLVWIETSQKTNNPLLDPAEFLASIGAE